MATFQLPDMPVPPMSPRMLLGAASPLWAYFGAATAGGVAWWWMTRWTSPQNLEALFEGAAAYRPDPAADLAVPRPEPVGAAATTLPASAPEQPSRPGGGELAPVSAFVAAISAPEPDPGKPRVRTPPASNGPDAAP